MKEFTFAILTYNHEKYIGLHLESIKYLIELYGRDINCHLVLRDDCSTDSTLKIVEKWINKNRSLFSYIDISANKHNLGICQNYQEALRAIKTEYFKVAAGDDLYFDSNLFEMCSTNSLVVTPMIYFDEYGPTDEKEWYIKKILLSRSPKKTAQRMMLFAQPAGAPSILWHWDLNDISLFEALSRYKYCDDTQLFEFLLFKDEVSFSLNTQPIMLYRISSGISHNLNSNEYSEYKKQYMEEEQRIKKEIFKHRLPESVINPYYTQYLIQLALYKHLLKYVSPRIRQYDEMMNQQIEHARKHIELIGELYKNNI